jgi:mitochondrial fission protein ELM1
MGTKRDINLWIVTEGIAGTENQCLAVAHQLGVLNPIVKRISLRQPFDKLSPFLFKTAPQWAIQGIDWNEPAPDIIIASGRKSIPIVLKYPSVFKVFIQNPKINTNHFDIVAAPMHDNLRGKNVITTIAAPNLITPILLNNAKKQFDLPQLTGKKIAILIGGNSKTHTMPSHFAYSLFEKLLPYLESDDYSVMVTASRRTPPSIRAELQTLFSTKNCMFWDGAGQNPYFGYLAAADYILVTEDSTSMLSDACSTGKPVYRIPLSGGSSKFNMLYSALENRCGLKIFDGNLETWTYEPLQDAKMIADEIKKSFANHLLKN